MIASGFLAAMNSALGAAVEADATRGKEEFAAVKELIHTAWERDGRAYVVVDVRKLGRGYQLLLEAADSKDKHTVRLKDLYSKYERIPLEFPVEAPRVALP